MEIFENAVYKSVYLSVINHGALMWFHNDTYPKNAVVAKNKIEFPIVHTYVFLNT